MHQICFGLDVRKRRAVFTCVSEPFSFALVFHYCDWLKKLAPLSRPIRTGKTRTNRDSLTYVFPRFAYLLRVLNDPLESLRLL